MQISYRHFNYSLGVSSLLHVALLAACIIHFQVDQVKIPNKPLYVKLGTFPNAQDGHKESASKVQELRPQPVLKAEDVQLQPTIPPPPSQAAPVMPQPTPKPNVATKKTPAKTAAPSAPVPISKPAPPPLVQHYAAPEKIMTPQPRPTSLATPEVPFVQHLQSKDYEVAGVKGDPLGNRTKAEQDVILKYEQQLALWLQKHKIYPLTARQKKMEGDAVVRVQIDRLGNVRFFELAEKTGFEILDRAVISMVERSNPVPPIPDNYPISDSVIEFLLPVTFRIQGE